MLHQTVLGVPPASSDVENIKLQALSSFMLNQTV